RFQSNPIRFARRELRCCFRQFAIRNTASARTVHYRATHGSAVLLLNSPLLGCRNEKYFTRLRTDLAHVVPGSPGATAATGGQIPVGLRNDGRLFHTDFGPVGFEFIGEHHRVYGSRTLTHLRYFREHGDLVVGGDPDPSIGPENLAVMDVLSSPTHRQIEAK